MKIYAFRLNDDRWVFYAPSQPAEAASEPAPHTRWGRFLKRVQKLQAESVEVMRTSRTRFWVWTRKMMAKLERLVHPCEPMARALAKVEEIELVHDGIHPNEEVVARWCAWLSERTTSHRRGMILNTCLLPLTSAAMVIPGPNVFFAWNALRLYGHWSAWRGLVRAAAIGRPLVTTDERLSVAEPPTIECIRRMADRAGLPGLPEYFSRLKALSGPTAH